MRSYELVLVFRPSLKEADTKKLLDTIKGWLTGVKITKEEDMGTKVLSYPIKKETSGAYFSLELEGDPSTGSAGSLQAGSGLPLDLEKKINVNDNIIRHLLIRTK
ncbi:MAG: 30S ribosomal protein S6 [Candidatus Levyibacteriota bacterium]